MNEQPTNTWLRLPSTLVETATVVAEGNGMTLEALILGAVQRDFESGSDSTIGDSKADNPQNPIDRL